MEINIVSKHALKTDYSFNGRLKRVILGWVIFIVLFIITKIPAVQETLQNFAQSVSVEWVSSTVNFIINGFWVFFIPMGIGTIFELKKQFTFSHLYVGDTGLIFVSDKEIFVPYSQVKISYGKLQQSFWLDIKYNGLSMFREFAWKEFEQDAVLRNHLETYGRWV